MRADVVPMVLLALSSSVSPIVSTLPGCLKDELDTVPRCEQRSCGLENALRGRPLQSFRLFLIFLK
ncbi:MAG TPA: hypothetical protein VGG33_01510 [Polyangia bacterium]